MKPRLNPLPIAMSAVLALTLTTGCARRMAQAPPQPPEPPPMAAAPTDPTPVVEPTPPPPPPTVASPEVDPAFFEFDSWALGETARAVLDRAAKLLRDQPGAKVTIEGHCDERGATEYNMSLGERRAIAARDYLIAAGVSGDRIQITSYGEERPFDEGHTDAAWARNRRAHLLVRVTPGVALTTDDSK